MKRILLVVLLFLTACEDSQESKISKKIAKANADYYPELTEAERTYLIEHQLFSKKEEMKQDRMNYMMAHNFNTSTFACRSCRNRCGIH